MKKKCVILIQIGISLLLCPLTVFANHQNLSVNLLKYKEVWVQNDQGNTVIQLKKIECPRPGDTLRYIVLCENMGDEKIMKAIIIKPIPAGTIYLPEIIAEDQDAEIFFSVDGGKTYHLPPIQNTVINKQGQIEIKEVPHQQYTHIQWLLKKPFFPKQCKKFVFKVRVNE